PRRPLRGAAPARSRSVLRRGRRRGTDPAARGGTPVPSLPRSLGGGGGSVPPGPAEERRGRPPRARGRARRRRRDGVAVKVARSPRELVPRDRAVAIGSFDGVHLGHRRVLETLLESGPTPTVVTFDP